MKRTAIILLTSVVVSLGSHAQGISPEVANSPVTAVNNTPIITTEQRSQVEKAVAAMKPEHSLIGAVKVERLEADADSVYLDLSEGFADVPFIRESIEALRAKVSEIVGGDNASKPIKLTIAGNDINQYFTSFEPSYRRRHSAFVTDVDPNRHYSQGLDGNIIAMWQSHGWYFEPKLNRWEWQRARVFQTVEDLYTQSYVMPFLNPMLENAGAYVWDPRERDTQRVEVIVDNDGHLAQDGYRESHGSEKWHKSDHKSGFAYMRKEYKDFENPFAEGTYRSVKTVTDADKQSLAHWDVEVPAAGDYAIYVSYKTVEGSSKDALYRLNTLNGVRELKIDQNMGGGVWVYLGHYRLAKGLNKDVVVLSNLSATKGAIVTADAVKVGGGIGNILRRPALPTDENKALAAEQENTEFLGKPGIEYKYQPSNHPRYTEGARYFLQWSGFPREVYSPSNGINDYTDDYRCRGEWVNYLAGGSQVLPGRKGLNVPVDMSMAFHSDAGTTMNDDIIGTLGIYCTKKNGKNFGKMEDGTPREISRNLTDLIVSQIVGDVRAKYEPKWTRRGMWDKSYYEARVPEVPAILLELLSHQNFADMKYGLDPSFRFTVSRAIYKGILKFIAQRDGRSYMVQPLPINTFAIKAVSDDFFMLTWEPTRDQLSDGGAMPTRYIVEERVGRENGFKELAVVDNPYFTVKISDHEVHSYRVVALNDGGRSFASEVLSLGVAPKSKGMIMVVNNFTRVSGPDWFDAGSLAGFADEKDHGVPYISQYNYLGSQFEFRRNEPWRDDDAGGFGASRSGYETTVIAGNTFDYPAVHGESILAAGYSFVSASAQAVERGVAQLEGFKAVDLIAGKQKETKVGRGAVPNKYKLFTPGLIAAVSAYTRGGGNVLLTGAYVGTDVWDNGNVNQSEVNFAKNVLGYEFLTNQAAQLGRVYTVQTPFSAISDGQTWEFATKLNSEIYAAESPDAIKPSDARGATIARYSENNIPAGIAMDGGNYRTVVLGFPLETVTDASQRDDIVGSALKFFDKD